MSEQARIHIAHAAQGESPDDLAFVHAVGLAAACGAKLTSVHACAAGSPTVELPNARTLLERWHVPVDRVAHACVQHTCCEEIDETLLDAMVQIGPSLVVLSTHARGGLARVLLGSVAEGVARNAQVPVLLLPIGGPSLVDAGSGQVRLSHMLLPVHTPADAEQALCAAVWFAALAGARSPALSLLHVDDRSPWPALTVPADWPVERVTARGPVDKAIAQSAEAQGADLVVMVTHGHDAPWDVLRASHTERVLHAAKRPLLWVPAGSALASVGSTGAG